jgi:hypothetical protein
MLHGASLRRLYETHGAATFCDLMGDLIESREVRLEDVSIRELAEATCGHEWVRSLHESSLRGQTRPVPIRFMEAGEGQDTTAFLNVMNQLVFTRIHQGWDEAGTDVDRLFTNVPTMFDGEKIPGVQQLAGEGELVRQGMPYPEVGLGDHVFETPSTTKHGVITSLNKETIFHDRTYLIVKRCKDNATRLRMNKSVRCWATVAGVTVQVGKNETFNGNNHKWNGTTYNTYSTGANAIGINALASTPLVDPTSIEQAELLFAALTHPDTGRPIEIDWDLLVCMPYKRITALRATQSPDVHTIFPGYGASSPAAPGNYQMDGANPYKGKAVMASALLQQVVVSSGISASNARDWWFLIKAGAGLEYRQNWDITTIPQTAPNSDAAFDRDIVMRWKSSEKGVPWVADPRYMVKVYNS